MKHQLGFIGLGRMGKNMVLHLLENHVSIVGYNRTRGVTEGFVKEASSASFLPAYDIPSLVGSLDSPRVVFLMVPNGQAVDDMIGQLVAGGMKKGDIIIDGGNCYYKDSVRRASELGQKGIHFIDCGTSGGLEGARNGACLMVGGEKHIVDSLSWFWEAASTPGGFAHFGPSGSGHFVKMVHNGVEYGMNQAIGEGFEILSKGPYHLDHAKVAENWTHGSVVRGWLMELLANAMKHDPGLNDYTGVVGGGQTGGWTIEAAKEFDVEASVLSDSVVAREKSRLNPTFAGKVVSALRAGYGGHKEPSK